MLIRKLGNVLQYFNPQEIEALILPKVMEKIRICNDSVKSSGAWFLANLIHNQYKLNDRQRMIDMILSDFASSKSFSSRKVYVMFCASAIKVMSYSTFKQHFFESYIRMASDQVTDVKIAFLNTVCDVRPFFENDPSALNEFNVCLSNFLMDPSSTIFELTS